VDFATQPPRLRRFLFGVTNSDPLALHARLVAIVASQAAPIPGWRAVFPGVCFSSFARKSYGFDTEAFFSSPASAPQSRGWHF
jgi:hypothetical protein